MGSYTKKMRKQMDEIHGKIMDGYRRGVCDKEGYSEKNEHGAMAARPRNMISSVTRKLCNRCRQWYYLREGHTCNEN